jgi:hypothetical protein
MKRALVLIPLVLLTAGCSPLLYPGPGRSMAASPYAMRSLAPAPAPVGRWDNVMRLPAQSTIDVLTSNGVPTIGPIVSADAQSVVVLVNGTDVRIARAGIVRVDLVDLAGSETAAVIRSSARGALLGAGAAALIGAVIGGAAWPPPGALVRAGVAGGAVSGGQAALAGRQARILYLAPSQPPVRYPSSQVPYPDLSDPSQGAIELPACADGASAAGIQPPGPASAVPSPGPRGPGVAGFARRVAGSARR